MKSESKDPHGRLKDPIVRKSFENLRKDIEKYCAERYENEMKERITQRAMIEMTIEEDLQEIQERIQKLQLQKIVKMNDLVLCGAISKIKYQKSYERFIKRILATLDALREKLYAGESFLYQCENCKAPLFETGYSSWMSHESFHYYVCLQCGLSFEIGEQTPIQKLPEPKFVVERGCGF